MAEPTREPTADEIAHGMGVLAFTEPDGPRREYLAAIHALALEALDLRAQAVKVDVKSGMPPVWVPKLAAEAVQNLLSDLRAQVRRLEEERDEAREIAERWSYSMSVGINLSSDEYFQLSADRKIIASWPQEGDGQ